MPEHQNKMGVSSRKGDPNMRASTAYFAGAGTVIAAIVGGVGGGLLIADMISPKSPKGVEMTRLERRMSPEPIQVATAIQQSTSQSTSAPVPTESQTQTQSQAKTQTAAPDPKPAPAQPPDAAASTQTAARPLPPGTVQPMAPEPTIAAGESVAKARDADLKRAAEKRRAERRQQWAEKRRHQQRQEQELQAVEETVRDETESRRTFVAEPARLEMRQIRLFGEE
jgi:hypothetical protein